MIRYLAGAFLLAVLLGDAGCARMEPSVQDRTQAPIESAEPNDPASPVAAVREPNQVESQSNEVRDPVAVAVEPAQTPTDGPADGEIGLNPIEVDRPPMQGASEPDEIPAEPNDAGAARPDSVLPVTAEPNDAGGQVDEDTARTGFLARYAAILDAYVREDGLVDYGSLRRRRLELKAFLMELDELDPNLYQGWSRQEKLAFWINAYNLKMLDIIARNYPIESSWWLRLTWSPSDIRHIGGIWTDYKFIVMEEEFTLSEVERRFFRRTFDDPRVYLALTYSSQSSPALRRRPYRGEDLDRQLDEQVRRFLSSPLGLRIDRRNRVVRLSALFKPSWRGKEFVGRYGTDKKFKDRDPETRAVLSFLTNYLSREDVYFLEVENYTLEYLNFDWRLNDTAKGY